jgi:two-component system nitrogen regulation sensor histidine kinase GlnL
MLALILLSQEASHAYAFEYGAVMEQYRDILDNISTGVLGLDGDLLVTSLNAAGEALLKTSAARCIGTHARQLVLDNGEWLANLEQVSSTRTALTRRGMPLTLHTGQEIHIDLTITPLAQPGREQPSSLLVELQPVDRLLKISREEGLLHAQETTRAVIRGLAHEIKNPLGGVRGAAQLLARELPSEELAEYTRVIIREADRLRDLVDRLLGPHQQLLLQPLNIHEILEHVRNLILAESDNRVTFIRDYDPSLPEIHADRTQLIQVVLNIMRNAMQVAPDPDSCVITVRTRSRRQFTIGTELHRLVCQVDIIDNGPGVPRELEHAIFVPMVTGRAEGTGLGLAIAQSVINHHGGLLECASEPGNTCFTLYIPMRQENA